MQIGMKFHNIVLVLVCWLFTLSGPAELFGHSPYGMWYRWRQARLFIVTTASAPDCYTVGKKLVQTLEQDLPTSEAGVVRAPHSLDVLKLILSHQFDVGLIPLADLERAVLGAPEFVEILPWIREEVPSDHSTLKSGSTPLRIITLVDDYALISADHFSAHRAHLIAKSITEDSGDFTLAGSVIPVHRGTSNYASGQALPPRPSSEKSWVD